MVQVIGSPSSFRRGSFGVETRDSGMIDDRRGPGSYTPFSHWCPCPKVSLGPSRPSFIGEASPEALPQARVYNSRRLGPVPSAPEPRSGTVWKSATGLPGRWGKGWFVPKPSKRLMVFQARHQFVDYLAAVAIRKAVTRPLFDRLHSYPPAIPSTQFHRETIRTSAPRGNRVGRGPTQRPPCPPVPHRLPSANQEPDY